MEMHGKLNLVDSQVKSDEFASTNQFNKLVVNNLSEIDQGTLDRDTIVINKDDDRIYTFNLGANAWVSTEFEINSKFDLKYIEAIDITEVQDVYNEIHLDRLTDLSVEPDLFDFGPIGSPIDFVIDFWLKPAAASTNGTILYNGINTGQVDLEINKNLLLSTNGTTLIKDPNYQNDPTYDLDPLINFKVNSFRPMLSSNIDVVYYHMVHVAMIRSGDTTYLAINGEIADSAPSVEYFHYDDVLIGSGYVNDVNYGIVNLRISKNTDRGWTEGFIPPNFNHIVDDNTDFLMDSTSNVVVDLTNNYAIVESGEPTVITQDRFYYEIPQEYNGSIIRTSLVQDKLVLKLPTENLPFNCHFDIDNTPIEVITLEDHKRYGRVQSTLYPINSSGIYNFLQTSKNIIVDPHVETIFRSRSSIILDGFQDAIYAEDGMMIHSMRDESVQLANYAVVNRVNHDVDGALGSINQDFYCNTTAYYGYGEYANTQRAGNNLYMFDAVYYLNGNHWTPLHNIYASGYGWLLHGYSSSYGIRMYYYNSVYYQFRNYDGSHIGDYLHVIFSFYRGQIQIHHINLNKESTYTIYTANTSASYDLYRRYQEAHGGNAQFSFIRHRLIDGDVSADQISSYIQQSYLK